MTPPVEGDQRSIETFQGCEENLGKRQRSPMGGVHKQLSLTDAALSITVEKVEDLEHLGFIEVPEVHKDLADEAVRKTFSLQTRLLLKCLVQLGSGDEALLEGDLAEEAGSRVHPGSFRLKTQTRE